MVTMNKSTRKSKPKKVANLRHAEYYDMQSTFDNLFEKSEKGETFEQLTPLIWSYENILLAYRNIKRNTGSVTPGTDGLTMRNLEKYTPDEMVRKVRNITVNYNPRAVRRKDIPKSYDPSKIRPLGIPCIWDRLIQQCILQILDPICEARFSDNSYGFRPNRNCEQAIATAYRLMQKSHMQYVVEVDIKGFFDNVDHSKLIKQIWAMGIRDAKLIYIIKRILKATIQLESGTLIKPTKGTPQGGIISPLLANIVLNELDRWVESQWQENPVTEKYSIKYNAAGFPIKSVGYEAMRTTRLKEMYIVRYADDFRIFCRNRHDAINTMAAVQQWLEQRLHLEVSAEKTRVVNLKKQYSDFLGIKMKLRKKGTKLVVKSHVCDKTLKRIHFEAKQKMKEIIRPTKGKTECQAVIAYNSYVMGVHNYYRVATDVSLDFRMIAYHIGKVSKHLGKRLKQESKSNEKNAVTKRYGESDQIRWISKRPIAPIGYIKTKAPMCKKKSIQKYTPAGRKNIHKNVGINVDMLQALLYHPLYARSTEYADNRLSLYCAQYGKCAITGNVFNDFNEIHCHHKTPRVKGGRDNYQNLTLIRKDVHILIHATVESTINDYLAILDLNKAQLRKLNKLRMEAGNQPIVV